MWKGALHRVIISRRNIFGAPVRWISATPVALDQFKCKVLVVGCGSGGCAVAAKLAAKLEPNSVIVVDPANHHYYQPMFTMIGGGMQTLADSVRPMVDVVPKGVRYICDSSQTIDNGLNVVRTAAGHEIKYDILVMAVGMRLNYEKIPGLVEALNVPNGNVTSIYSPKYVHRHFEALKRFESGHIIFTFPASPVKCPGAPQKICYITEHYLRKQNKRSVSNITYITALPVIFGVKYFANALWKVIEKRSIAVQLKQHLIEVRGAENLAIFQSVDNPEEKQQLHYDILHVTPPQEPALMLQENKHLTNEAGFVDVNMQTLQHTVYPNVFAIGDCSSSPNSKTMAAAAAQAGVLTENILAVLAHQPLPAVYDGYASCPLVTGYDTCILAEFDYNLEPLETFPMAQDQERYSMFLLKKHLMPYLYWYAMVPGLWSGPAQIRKLMSHLKM